MATPQKKCHWSHFSLKDGEDFDKGKRRKEVGERKARRQERVVVLGTVTSSVLIKPLGFWGELWPKKLI